jgi:putative transcriptional regulator
VEYKTVGNRLRDFRLEARLTQEEVAKAIGVTRQTVIAMEKGNYVPSVLLALMSAKLFGRNVEELFYVIESR